LFTVLLSSFQILEDVGVGLYHHQSFQQSTADLGGGTWKGIFTLTALLFVVLIPFVGFGELRRVLGEEKLKELFIGRSAAKDVLPLRSEAPLRFFPEMRILSRRLSPRSFLEERRLLLTAMSHACAFLSLVPEKAGWTAAQ
jgi:hypothetical protein